VKSKKEKPLSLHPLTLSHRVNGHGNKKEFRFLKFEALKGKKKGFYSIRLNIQYRLIFTPGKDINETTMRIAITQRRIIKIMGVPSYTLENKQF
jgi:hypothetical protein